MSNNTANTDKTVDFLSYLILGLLGILAVLLLGIGYFWMFPSHKNKDVALTENAQASVTVSETIEKKDIKPEPQENTVAKEVPPIIIEPNEVQEPIEQVEDEKQIQPEQKLDEQNESSIEEAIKPLNQFNKTQEEIEQELKDARLHCLREEYEEAVPAFTELVKNGIELDIEHRYWLLQATYILTLEQLTDNLENSESNQEIRGRYFDLIYLILDEEQVEKFEDAINKFVEGCAFQEEKKYEEAIDKFNDVIKIAPFDMLSKVKLATCRIQNIRERKKNEKISMEYVVSITNDTIPVLIELESIIEKEPRFDFAYVVLAQGFVNIGSVEPAIENMKMACRLQPDDEDYKHLLQMLLESEKKNAKKQPVTIMAFNRLKLGTSRQQVVAMFGECNEITIKSETMFSCNWNLSPPEKGHIILYFQGNKLKQKAIFPNER